MRRRTAEKPVLSEAQQSVIASVAEVLPDLNRLVEDAVPPSGSLFVLTGLVHLSGYASEGSRRKPTKMTVPEMHQINQHHADLIVLALGIGSFKPLLRKPRAEVRVDVSPGLEHSLPELLGTAMAREALPSWNGLRQGARVPRAGEPMGMEKWEAIGSALCAKHATLVGVNTTVEHGAFDTSPTWGAGLPHHLSQ